MLARLKVLLSTHVTYLVTAVAFLTRLEAELPKLGPVPASWSQWIARAITVLGAIVTIVSTRTPVAKSERGILP